MRLTDASEYIECSCYETDGGHQMGCQFHGRSSEDIKRMTIGPFPAMFDFRARPTRANQPVAAILDALGRAEIERAVGEGGMA